MIIHFKNKLPNSFKQNIKNIFRNVLETVLYRLSIRHNFKKNVHHIIFICKGNICRSAFAEHFMKSVIYKKGIRIESYGLDVERPILPPPDALTASKKCGINLSMHRSKRLSISDLKNADLIIPMEFGQLRRLLNMFPKCRNKTILLRDFAPFPDNLICNINDPYELGLNEFMRCFQLIQKAINALANRI